jgi:hypothetical protein
MGGQVQSSVGINAGFLQLDVLSDYVGDAANLLADLAINAKFTDEDRRRKTDGNNRRIVRSLNLRSAGIRLIKQRTCYFPGRNNTG